MIRLEFSGSAADLQAMLSSLPADFTNRLVVSFIATGQVGQTLEQRAIAVAREHMIKPGYQKLQAIKAVRELTNWGLKDAKEFVEKHFPDGVPRDQ